MQIEGASRDPLDREMHAPKHQAVDRHIGRAGGSADAHGLRLVAGIVRQSQPSHRRRGDRGALRSTIDHQMTHIPLIPTGTTSRRSCTCNGICATIVSLQSIAVVPAHPAERSAITDRANDCVAPSGTFGTLDAWFAIVLMIRAAAGGNRATIRICPWKTAAAKTMAQRPHLRNRWWYARLDGNGRKLARRSHG